MPSDPIRADSWFSNFVTRAFSLNSSLPFPVIAKRQINLECFSGRLCSTRPLNPPVVNQVLSGFFCMRIAINMVVKSPSSPICSSDSDCQFSVRTLSASSKGRNKLSKSEEEPASMPYASSFQTPYRNESFIVERPHLREHPSRRKDHNMYETLAVQCRFRLGQLWSRHHLEYYNVNFYRTLLRLETQPHGPSESGIGEDWPMSLHYLKTGEEQGSRIPRNPWSSMSVETGWRRYMTVLVCLLALEEDFDAVIRI
nr:hypothetical protein Iba_chr06bCG7750 [Ipomoea batatas]